MEVPRQEGDGVIKVTIKWQKPLTLRVVCFLSWQPAHFPGSSRPGCDCSKVLAHSLKEEEIRRFSVMIPMIFVFIKAKKKVFIFIAQKHTKIELKRQKNYTKNTIVLLVL